MPDRQTPASRPGRRRLRAALTAVAVLGVALLLGVGTPSAAAAAPAGTAESAAATAVDFDPGLLISDGVFDDSHAMTLRQIRAFIADSGADCDQPWCLKNLRLHVATEPADEFCRRIPGGIDDAAELIWKVSLACGVNPQVMLVTLQKESGMLTATRASEDDYTAAWGWHCPDTGPRGTANCDPRYSGFIRQAKGMAKQWARYTAHPEDYHFHAGQTTEIAYDVDPGCGGAPVHIRNRATAALYNYTPYQPNAASLAGYPGTGDACSSYGNRNFVFLFTQYFGSPTAGAVAIDSGMDGIDVSGVEVTIPDSPYVPDGLAGRTVTAPTAAMARGLAAGLAALGTPYVWGGGTDNGAADEGCSRGGGARNSCQGIVGFDCSGLTGYVLARAGFAVGTNSAAQRSGGTDVDWSDAQPGDIIGYDGHVTIYLGEFDGVPYMLEAPGVGQYVHIRDVHGSADPVLHRYWA